MAHQVIRHLAKALALAALAAAAPAQTPLTADLADDSSPAVHPNGRDLVFVSTRDGYRALYRMRLDNPSMPPARVAPHPTDTDQPAFSPDGTRLAFRAFREDALGDIFTMAWPDGEPVRLTRRGTADESPLWLNESTVMFRRPIDVGGTPIDFRKSLAEAPDAEDTMMPADAIPFVPFAPPFPIIAIRPRATVAVLAADDTTGDGFLSREDQGSLWRYSDDGRWRPIGFATPGLQDVVPLADGHMVTVAAPQGNLDLFLAAAEPELAGTAEELSARARAAELDSPESAARPLALWRAAFFAAPGTAQGRAAALAWVRLEIREGRAAALADTARISLRPAFRGTAEEQDLEALLLLAEAQSLRSPAPDGDAQRIRARIARARTAATAEQGAVLHLAAAHLAARTDALQDVLDETAALLAADGADGGLRGAALLLRADALARAGFADDARDTRLRHLREAPEPQRLARAAAERLIAAVTAGLDAEAGVIAIRTFAAAHPDLPMLQAQAALSQARMLRDLGRTADAHQQFARAIGSPVPFIAASATLERAAMLAAEGRFEEAVTLHLAMQARVEEAGLRMEPALLRRMRDGAIARLAEQARDERAKGDPALALATARKLAGFAPDSAEGWREMMAAEDALGLMPQRIREYRRAPQDAPQSALAWYKAGLAESYMPGRLRAARKALERAVALDPSVPFYHQTLGYVYEQLARRGGSADLRIRAYDAYRAAASRLDTAARPAAAADLALNTGNAALLMDRNMEAALAYRQRDASPVAFGDPLQELLFRLNHGIASFRSADPATASAQFRRGLALLSDPGVRFPKVLGGEAKANLRRELTDRLALALAESGDIDSAEATYRALVPMTEARSLDRVRALRGLGLSQILRARSLPPAPRTALLREARAALRESLGLLQDGVRITERNTGGGGLFSIDMALSMGNPATGGAKADLSRADEERILRSALARIAEELGEPAEAESELRAFLAAVPKATDETRAYYSTQRAAALMRIARLRQQQGDTVAMRAALEEALGLTRFAVAGAAVTNWPLRSQILLKLTEASLALGDDAERLGAISRYRDMTIRAMAEAEPEASGADALSAMRLRLASALAAEALWLAGADAMLAAARTDAAAVAPLAAGVADATEANRLVLYAKALGLRMAARAGDAEAALADALAFAEATGQRGLAWFLHAQVALHGATPELRAAHAAAARDALADALPGERPSGIAPPWALFDLLEDEDLLATEAEFGRQWDAVEAWRVARLRWIADAWTPAPRGIEDEAALRDIVRLRESLRGVQARLRAIGGDSPARQPLVAEESALRTALRARIEEGHAAAMPSALTLCAPRMPFADVSAVLDGAGPGSSIPAAAALVLRRRLARTDIAAAYTADGVKVPDVSLAGAAPIWFVLGDAVQAPEGVTAVRVLSSASLLGGADQLYLERASQPVTVRDGASSGSIGLAWSVSLPEAPLGASPDAAAWRLADGTPLPDITARFEGVRRLSAVVPAMPGADANREAAALAMAALAANAGVVEATLSGQRWIGAVYAPTAARESAVNEIEAAQGSALARLEEGNPRAAIPHLEDIVALRRSLGMDDGLLTMELLLAQSYGDVGRADLATDASARAVALARASGDTEALARSLLFLGQDASRAERYAEAAAALGEAVALFRQLGDRGREERAVATLGIAQENSGEYAAAIESYRAAAAIAEADGRVLDRVRQMRREARVLLQRQSRYAEAEALLARATDLLAAPGAQSAEHAELLARVFIDRSLAAQRTGQLAGADAFLDSASLYAVASAQSGTTGTAAAAASRLMHLVATERATVQWLRAEYREAFVAARESVNSAEAAGDSESLIQAENLSGLVSWSLNDLDRANRSLERALALAKAANLRGEVASTHNNRGLVRRSERRFAEAIAEFEASLAIDRAMANRWGEAYSLRNIGLTRLESGDAEGAVDPLQQAAGIAGTIGDRVNEAKALLSLADALARLARAAEAKPVYGRALAIAEELPLPEVRWRARYGLAQLARAEGRAEDARALLAATIEDLETIRAAIRVEEFQDGFLADKQAPYDAMVTLLLDLGDARAAFEFSERSRGRNFIDLLGNQKLQLGDVTDQRLLDRERELRSAVESLERTRGAAPQSERPGITERLNAARRAYSDFIVELRAANRQLEAFVRVEPVSLADVQALLPEDTRLLAYHVLDRELVAWLVGRDSLQTYRMPVGRGALAKQIASVRMRLQDLDPVDEPLAQLASALIVPLAVDLRGVRRLGIVPHRELHAMPFAALPVTAREALIDRCALFYVPSSSVLGYTIGRRPAAEALREPRVLALGNPSLGEKSLSLPFAQKEAERLALQFPGATEVTGGAATETWLRGNIADYTIVHIASHGEFDPEEPLFSSLLLTPDDANDGRLTAAEVFGLALRADLVTLSACQTGLGRLSNGDDIVGLNRAFVYAGTRQMVTSLWRVDDIATAVLMKHFYREIGTMDRAAALREAMLRVRARFPHPAYWSGVVLSGDWQ